MELILIPDSLTTGIVAFLFICSIMTSMVTASFGVGGGLLLLVLMAMWVPPAAIIPVHGIIQFASNGGRVVLTWRNINWKVLAAFIPGVVAGSLLGTLLLVQLPAYIWQLTIGLFVLYLCWGPGLPKAVLGSAGVFIAATATTFIGLFVGATGPLVAAFIKQIKMDRFGTVATQAAAMALQHAPKAIVFGFAGFVFQEWLLFMAGMAIFGFVGTWLGLHVLRTISNKHFHRLFNIVLTLLSVRLLWQAGSSMLN